MCDLLPEKVWQDIHSTFLEPSCGTGNFLAEILKRKLALCKDETDVLAAYNSIYGIDILEDNVDETRQRLFNILPDYAMCVGVVVLDILRKNIVCGDALKIMQQYEE